MPGEHVDGAPFAADLERDLGHDVPTDAAEPVDRPFDQTGVPGVEESIQRLALPEDGRHEPRPERRCDSFEAPDGDVCGAAAFDAGDRRGRRANSLAERGLGPAQAPPKGPH